MPTSHTWRAIGVEPTKETARTRGCVSSASTHSRPPCTTNSRAAKSFLEYGKRIDSPRVGAIVVLTRGNNGGHVGIVRGTDGAGNIIVISGNHGNKVWESPYPKSRVLGYVVPSETN